MGFPLRLLEILGSTHANLGLNADVTVRITPLRGTTVKFLSWLQQ